jgi:hypothetical protein
MDIKTPRFAFTVRHILLIGYINDKDKKVQARDLYFLKAKV